MDKSGVLGFPSGRRVWCEGNEDEGVEYPRFVVEEDFAMSTIRLNKGDRLLEDFIEELRAQGLDLEEAETVVARFEIQVVDGAIVPAFYELSSP